MPKIRILELLKFEGFFTFRPSLNKHVYFVPVWDEPYRSNIKKGDECFIIDRTLDTPGIIAHGSIDSNVYRYQLPKSYYAADQVLLTDCLRINPDKYRLLSTDYLQTAMPEIGWGPHLSGWEVTGPYVKKLRRIWKEYLEMNDYFI